MPRRQILTPAEYAAFETPPVFSNEEREKFFQVGESLESLLATLRTSTNQIFFLLTLGYFRATKRFFAQPFHQEDVKYVVGKLGKHLGQLDLEAYDKKATASRHRQLTLNYLGFQAFNTQARQNITQEIHTMVRSQMRPKAIFLNVLEILETRKTEIPSARTLTDLITEETNRHQRELTETLEVQLSPAQRELLDALLDKQETSGERESKVQRFKLTLLKRFSQSTKPKSIKANIEDLRTLRTLYNELKSVVTSLDLAPEGIRYYANSVIKSRVDQVSRRAEDERNLQWVRLFLGKVL